MQALKKFGAVCPFLHRVSPLGLRALSSSATVEGHNRLALLATSACPMMSAALKQPRSAAAAFSTSAAPASAPTPTPAAPAANQTRAYASIADQQAESHKLQRQQAEDILAKATAITHESASKEAGSAVDPSMLDPVNMAPSSGRPTCRLGFAKHEVTSARPGYDYEQFYQGELDKKHKDKSYRYFNNINRYAGRYPIAHTAPKSASGSRDLAG